jgi:hypothetical protein
VAARKASTQARVAFLLVAVVFSIEGCREYGWIFLVEAVPGAVVLITLGMLQARKRKAREKTDSQAGP